MYFFYLLFLSFTRTGVDVQNCYYVINPANNLPQLEVLFKSISSSPAAQSWKGVFNVPPSKEEFLTGLQENDLFVYVFV